MCTPKRVWAVLDSGERGHARLCDLDEHISELLQGFSTAAVNSCGSAEAAWRKHFTHGHEHLRCSMDTFKVGAQRIGYAGDVRAVFNALDADGTGQGLLFDNFVLLDKWFRQSQRRDRTSLGIFPWREEP